MSKINRVSLDELIRSERRPVEVHPDEQYEEIGIYSFGRGIFHKLPRSGFEVGNKKLFQIKDGDLIFQITFAWEGAVGLASPAEDGMYGSVRFPTFRIDDTKCVPSYLLYYFRTEEGRDQLGKISPGSAGRNRVLSLKRIPEVIVPLPPLDVQRRTVARIEELAAKIEEAQKLRRQAAEEAEALLAASIKRSFDNITIDGHLSDVLLEKPRNGWSAKCDNADTGIPVLTLTAVTGFQYRENEFKRTSEPTSPSAHYWLHDDDLLITRSNTPELVGHAAIYNGKPKPCIYPDLMMRLNIDTDQAEKHFILWWLRNPGIRDYITRNAKGSSPTMKKINQKIVMDIPYSLNVTIDEQRRIVARLDELQAQVDRLKKHQVRTAEELDAFLPAVLDRAFRGQL